MLDYYLRVLLPMQVVSVRLKLIINIRSNTVVHAEVDKHFVDWLFQMLNMPAPLATFIEMALKGEVMNGSLGNLYTSIQNLINSHHILTNDTSFFKQLRVTSVMPYNPCPRGHIAEIVCSDCHKNIGAIMRFVSAPMVKEGSYIVTDDLVVKPVPTKGHFLPSLEERVVDVVIGEDEAVKLIHAVFIS